MNVSLTGFYNLFTSAFLALAAPVSGIEVCNILTVDSLAQISIDQPKGTLFLFDLDDTVFDSKFMLGSQAWRRYIKKATQKIDSSQNWHDIISHDLAQRHPFQTVEKMTSQFIKDLQAQGLIVCGLTSRQRKLWYDMPVDGVDALTIEQLKSVDVNFDNQSLENAYPYLSRDSEYVKGVFFANEEPKGKYLSNLLENAPELPEKVIFIDDKASQVESVAYALALRGIHHECYTYNASEEKGKKFDPLLANIQLYCFYESDGNKIVSDQEAAEIAKQHSEKDAEYYLKNALEIIREKKSKDALR